jgi:phage shock protein PspC (stress-responsive transcriptional regulator)
VEFCVSIRNSAKSPKSEVLNESKVDKTKQKERRSGIDDVFDITETELETTLESYLETEEQDEKPRLLNFISITGLAMLTVGFLAVLQQWIPTMSLDVVELLSFLPILGGILVLLYGLGIVGGEKKKNKRKEKKVKELKEHTRARYMSANRDEKSSVDAFAFKKKKKLFKSVKDKKLLGVCGGIGDYLGIDTTLIRILFVVFFLIGSGTPALVYLALGVILDKEPPVLQD